MDLKKIGRRIYVKCMSFDYTACFYEKCEVEPIQSLNRVIIESIHHGTDSSVNRFSIFELILHLIDSVCLNRFIMIFTQSILAPFESILLRQNVDFQFRLLIMPV